MKCPRCDKEINGPEFARHWAICVESVLKKEDEDKRKRERKEREQQHKTEPEAPNRLKHEVDAGIDYDHSGVRSKIIGIDLGTTKCSVAAMVHGKPMIIPNARGNTTTPSVVAFGKDGKILVGEDALSQAVLNVKNTFFNVKRSMGSSQKFEVGGKTFTPQQIVGHLLTAMKLIAEAYLGESVDRAVVSVPTFFNDAQRWFTYDAGKIAGLDVLRIINEPTAAALAYGLDKKHEQTILVFDLGGGTFDVSILEIGEGVFEVKAVNGDTHLGGIDFDKRIADWLIDEFAKDYPDIDLRDDAIALERLMDAAEKAKIQLSSTNEAEIHLPYIMQHGEHMLNFITVLTRSKLEEITSDLVKQTIEKCSLALSDAMLNRKDIDKVILVGRQTKMPAVYRAVTGFFDKEPSRSVDPAEAVAIGATIEAAVLVGEIRDVLLLNVTPLSLGIETRGGISTRMIERNTTIPTKRSEIFSTAEDNQTSVEVHVLQGEREMAAYNKMIGTLHLTGIPPSPRGIPQIEVTFYIDANGIVHVLAKDLSTGKEVKARIEDRGTSTKPAPGTICPYGRWSGETSARKK